jgi:signal transduction histidine kinase/TPR repeat protein
MDSLIRTVAVIVLFILTSFLEIDSKGYSQDLVIIDSLQKVLTTQKEDTNRINNLVTLSRSYFNVGDIKSTNYLNEIYLLSQKLSFTPGITDYYYLKAIHFNQQAQHDSALSYINRAISLLDSVNDFKRQAKYYRNYAIIQRRLGHPGTASLYYKKSLELFQKLNDEDGITKSLASLGLLFDDEMKYDSALSYYYKSLALAEAKNNTNLQLAPLINIGKIFVILADYENALKYFNRSLELSQKEKYLSYIGLTYQNLGLLYHMMNKDDEALFFYDTAIRYFDTTESILLKAQTLMNIGSIYREKGDSKSALNQYRKSQSVYHSVHNTQGIIDNNMNIALIYEDNGNYSKTLQIYDSCLVLVKTSNYKEILPRLYFNISKAHELAGNWSQAHHYLTLHYLMKDSIFNIENGRVIKDLELTYEKEKNEANILALQNENLQKDITIRHRTSQRNLYFFFGLFIIILGVMILILVTVRNKKNKVILEQKLKQVEDEKKLMAAQSLVEGQDLERKRIATDLHDGLGVLLSSVTLQFSNILDNAHEHKDLILKAQRLLEQAAQDVRKISHNMMPSILSRFGLIEAVESMFDQIDNPPEISALVNITGSPKRLTENCEIMLYRIIQELLNNTIKHAGAKNISLNMHFDQNIRIQYSDNGKGFDIEDNLSRETFGLVSIISRVGFLNGEISFESKPDKGFTAFVDVPGKYI